MSLLTKCGILNNDTIIKREELIKCDYCINWCNVPVKFKEAFMEKFDEAVGMVIEEEGEITGNEIEIGLDILNALDTIGFLINKDFIANEFNSIYSYIMESYVDKPKYNITNMKNLLTFEQIKDTLREIEECQIPFIEKLEDIEAIGGIFILKNINGGQLIFNVVETYGKISYYIPVTYEIVDMAEEEEIENSKNIYDFVFSTDDITMIIDDDIRELDKSLPF